jgi:hypothetical protein
MSAWWLDRKSHPEAAKTVFDPAPLNTSLISFAEGRK